MATLTKKIYEGLKKSLSGKKKAHRVEHLEVHSESFKTTTTRSTSAPNINMVKPPHTPIAMPSDPCTMASTPVLYSEHKSLQHISDRAPESSTPTHRPLCMTSVQMSRKSGKNDGAKRGNNRRVLSHTNSTATVYVDQTITVPHRDIILLCLAKALHRTLTCSSMTTNIATPKNKKVTLADDAENNLFLESIHPLTRNHVESRICPTVDAIYTFIRKIFKEAMFEGETALVAMVYVTRLQEHGGIVLIPDNWKWVFLGCIILGAKAWDDMAVWVNDFQDILPVLTLDQFNVLERVILKRLMFNLSVTPREYAQHYFDLRGYTSKDELEILGIDRAPLNIETARKLGGITVRQEEVLEWKRWQSTGTVPHKAPLAIIS